MNKKRCFASVVWMFIYLFVGVIVYLITSSFLNSRNSQTRDQLYLTGIDSCMFDASSNILDLCQKADGLVFYLEVKACAVCSENAIKKLAMYLHDSIVTTQPLLLFHPIVDIDSTIMADYHNRFDKYFDVVVCNDDSIMIKNPWLPKSLGFYGFLIDSDMRVLYAGSVFEPVFLSYCKGQLKNNDN